MKTISMGTDHAGYELKEFLKEKLTGIGHTVTDCGASLYEEMDDYPDFIKPAAQMVADKKADLSVIIGGSGQGEAIVANRICGVRAIVYNSENLKLITLAREHNDANAISIGSRFVSKEHALSAVELFISTNFTNEERHERRIKKIDQ